MKMSWTEDFLSIEVKTPALLFVSFCNHIKWFLQVSTHTDGIYYEEHPYFTNRTYAAGVCKHF